MAIKIKLILKEVTHKEEWNKFAVRTSQSIFLQSWEWGEFQIAAGRKVRRLGLYSEQKLVGIAQCVAFPLPFGKSYWLIPRGPVVVADPGTQQFVFLFTEFLHLLSSELRGVHIKVEPFVECCYEAMFLLIKNEAPLRESNYIHPIDSRVLALAKSEDELLAEMHQKTRYNIRLAEKKGVTIETGKQYVDDFIRLNKETALRDRFVSHQSSYYKKMVTVLPEDFLTVYAAKKNGAVLAANIVIHFGDTTTYLHGASSSQDRAVMAPHLLQWRQIQDAKKQKSTYYDFYGIAPEKRSNSPVVKKWAGITRFKNGFGGIEKNYVGTFDLPIQGGWYSLYRIAKRLRNR